MRIIVDTGAIFGMLDRRDQWHAIASRLFTTLPKPFYTCEAVLAETCFLLNSAGIGSGCVMGLIKDGILALEFQMSLDFEAVARLMKKYELVPMSLADACLVRMSEIFDASVFTFDSDFRIYRRSKRSLIPLVGIDS